MKIFIIHGWSGHPEEAWFPWLKNKLEEKGHEVQVPQMPNKDTPNIEEWVNFLKKHVQPDENTFFIGHSIGCQTIMRYIVDLNIKIGGALFVAGFFNLIEGSMGDEEQQIAKPWLETPINTDKIKQNCKKIVTIFSDNDPYVPVSDSKIFKNKLEAETLILEKKGHMGASDNCPELPIALEILEEMFK
ncbi:MAG: alpha/beta hydrolase [Nanoarchaeota archaeon]|nr:alpha/beta hydrolase [Nanoarchaeota archaeon]